MKKIILLILFVFTSSFSFGQKKELKKGLKSTNANGFHVAYFDNYRSTKKIKKWLDKNGYVMIDSKTKLLNKRGMLKKGIYYIEYATRATLLAYENAQQRNATQRESDSWSASEVILGLAAIAGIAYVGDKLTSSNTDSQPLQNTNCDHKLIAENRYLGAIGYLDIESKIPEVGGWGSKKVLTRHFVKVLSFTSDRKIKIESIDYKKLTKDGWLDGGYNFDSYHQVQKSQLGEIHYAAENLICFYRYAD